MKEYKEIIKSKVDFIRYYKLAVEIYNNAEDITLDENEMYEYYVRGVNLWNKLFKKWNELRDKPDNYLIDIITNSRPGIIGNSVLKKYFAFEKRNRVDSSCDIEKILFAVGEGDTLIKDSKNMIKFIKNRSDGFCVDIICGPVIVEADKSRRKPEYHFTNDFVLQIAEFMNKQSDNNKYNLYVNKFPSLIKGFAGYFHCYLMGDAILFEKMHRLCVNVDKTKFLLYDKDLANELQSFVSEYIEKFTRPVDASNHRELVEAFDTYPETVFDSTFDENYVDKLLKILEIA
ncbi:MAG: hypothetical protein LBD23_18830 [Oscillospiraceae bacterium]|jgi:hypothetical protein|nr:hypothetical protein [Oscillospiraceae bacterium]